MAATDSKSLLVQFLQRSIGRTLTKADVIYTTHNSGEHFQSTVKLVCKEGEEYAGELCTNDKEAMQSAAAQALADFAAEIAALPEKPPKTKGGKAKDPNAGLMAMMGLGAAAGAAAVPNSKTELVQKLQAHCKRGMTKADITYEVARVTDGFQATVKLVCAGGQEFTGEVATGEKLAQHAAAQQALLNAHMWMAATMAPAQPVKRKMPDPTSVNPKSDLVIFLQGHLKRTLIKTDVVYAAAQTEGGGYQATVELTCYQGRQFAGEVCENAKAAEAAAATQALMSLSAELGQPAPTVKRQKTAMGGRATGGRPVAAAAAWPGAPLALMGKGQGQTGGVMNQPRNLIAPDTITGEVIEWNDVGGFGWVRAFAEIDHPEAHKRGGKIFIHKKDLSPQVTPENPVGTGSMIQFKVYADNRGLGACEVQPL